jgi:YbbR domain-containing protein
MTLPGFATRNVRLKALALVLAAVMWTGVAYASNPPDTRTVSIRVPQSAGEIAPYTLVHPIPDLLVRVSGTRQHLNDFDPSELTLTVNYRAIRQVGVQTIPVTVVNNDRDVILDGPLPVVIADFDHLSSRTIGVTVVVTAQPPQGYLVVSSSTTPSTVTVIGPQHQLGAVEARVSVSLANQKTNFQAGEQVVLVGAAGQPLNLGVTIAGRPAGGGVLVTILVTPSLTSRASAVLPKVFGSPPSGHYLGGVRVSPATVVLDGPQDLLNTLDSVPTQSISLQGIEGIQSFTVKVLPPAGVTAAPASVTVTVTIIAIPQPTPTPTPTPTPAPTTSP